MTSCITQTVKLSFPSQGFHSTILSIHGIQHHEYNHCYEHILTDIIFAMTYVGTLKYEMQLHLEPHTGATEAHFCAKK